MGMNKTNEIMDWTYARTNNIHIHKAFQPKTIADHNLSRIVLIKARDLITVMCS